MSEVDLTKFACSLKKVPSKGIVKIT